MKRGRFLLMIMVLVVIGFVVLVQFYREMHSQRDEKVKSTSPRKVIREKVGNEKE